MTVGAGGWSAVQDPGLGRTFDLGRKAVRSRRIRRGLCTLVVLVGGIGLIVAAGVFSPETVVRPVLELPLTATRVGLGLMGLAVVVMLVGAPVTADQHSVVSGAAVWMAQQPGTSPLHLGLILEGVGIAMINLGVMGLVVGIVLVVEGVVLLGLALSRARSARRWLSLYAVPEGRA